MSLHRLLVRFWINNSCYDPVAHHNRRGSAHTYTKCHQLTHWQRHNIRTGKIRLCIHRWLLALGSWIWDLRKVCRNGTPGLRGSEKLESQKTSAHASRWCLVKNIWEFSSVWGRWGGIVMSNEILGNVRMKFNATVRCCADLYLLRVVCSE